MRACSEALIELTPETNLPEVCCGPMDSCSAKASARSLMRLQPTPRASRKLRDFNTIAGIILFSCLSQSLN